MKVISSNVLRKCPICNSNSLIKGYSFDIFKTNNKINKAKCLKRKCTKCDIEYFDLIKGVNNFGKAVINLKKKDLESKFTKKDKYKRRHFMLDKLLITLFKDNIRFLT